MNPKPNPQPANPFQIFPTLVWDVVFKESVKVDPEINPKLLRAYPELDAEFEKKKTLLLFGQVLPILCEWKPGTLDANDMLNCRAVCSCWRDAVHHYLDHQPGLVLFDPNVHDAKFCIRQELVREQAVLTHAFDSWEDQEWAVIRSHRTLSKEEKISLSPELYRNVSFRLETDYVGNEEDVKGCFRRFCTFIENFGPFVRSLTVFIIINDYEYASLQLLELGNEMFQKIFGLLPGLRQLNFDGAFPFNMTRVADSIPTGIQSLVLAAQERTSTRTGIFEAILSKVGLINLCHFGLSFSSLRTDSEFVFSSNETYYNLTKLDLVDIAPHDSGEVKTLLSEKLNAPNLTSLTVRPIARDPNKWTTENNFRIESHVFRWLSRFPNLLVLKLGSKLSPSSAIVGGSANDLSLEKVTGPAPPFSLCYIDIKKNENTSFQFLRYLPSLKVLVVRLDEWEGRGEETEERDEDDSDGDSQNEDPNHPPRPDFEEHNLDFVEEIEEEDDWEQNSVEGEPAQQHRFFPPRLLSSKHMDAARPQQNSVYDDEVWEAAPKLFRVIIRKMVNGIYCRQEYDRWSYERKKGWPNGKM